jgi:predicted aspartyl protease
MGSGEDMKFKYRYLRDSSGSRRDFVRLPLLQVRLGFGANNTDVVGLVDTGATDCLFDRDVADDLRIKLADSDITREYVGVGGQSVLGHIHVIRFQIQGFSEWVEIEVGFIDAKLPYQLLGQSGFFDNYEISFQRYRGRFEIKSRSFLHRN